MMAAAEGMVTVSELVRKYKALKRECLARQRAKSERVMAANFVSGAGGDTSTGPIAWEYRRGQLGQQLHQGHSSASHLPGWEGAAHGSGT